MSLHSEQVSRNHGHPVAGCATRVALANAAVATAASGCGSSASTATLQPPTGPPAF